MILCCLFVACSVENQSHDSNLAISSGLALESSLHADADQKIQAQRWPWEIWPVYFNANGESIKNNYIVEGDRAFENADRKQAFELYLKAQSQKLEATDRECLALRIIGMKLVQGQSAQALADASKYFKAANITSEAVSPEFSLLLAYAYGGTQNYEQSLAWFSKTYRLSHSNGNMASLSRQGLKDLLATVTESQLLSLASLWEGDEFVRSQIGQERMRRGSNHLQVNADPTQAFWLQNQQKPLSLVENSLPKIDSVPNQAAKMRSIGVILPLSGLFANLGANLKNGIDLAFLDAVKAGSVSLVVRDSQGEPSAAVAAFQALQQAITPTVVLGPLLSEPAVAVARYAREYSIPLLTYSKRNDFDQVGSSSFRLGVTTRSQISSLTAVAIDKLSMSGFALVAPDDLGAGEYAQEFRQALAQRGLSLAFDASYNKSDPNSLLALVKEIEPLIDQGQVKAVFMPDSLVNVTRFITDVAPSKRSKIRLMGTANWDNSPYLENSKTVLEGAIYVSAFNMQSKRPEVKQFVESFKQKYGYEPDFLAAQGFDSATMVLAAMQKLDSGFTSFIDALYSIQGYNGLTGNMSVSPNGEVERQFAVIEMNNGRLRQINLFESVKEEVQG